MGIIRLVTVVAILWLAWFFFKRFQQNMLERKQSKKKETPVSNVKECAVCGVHVPETEALSHNGRYYCSIAHKSSDT